MKQQNVEIREIKGVWEEIRLRYLYRTAFPPAEKKPFSMIKKRSKEGKAEILGIYTTQGRFAGLAITMFYKDLVLLDYFAVAPKQRNGGTGSEALKKLQKRYPDKRFFLEIESTREAVPEEEQRIRKRRKAFYQHCGMKELECMVELFGVEMELLSYNCSLTYEEYENLYRDVLGRAPEKYVKRIKG